MTCGDAVEPPIGIEPMTYSLQGSYIPEEHSTGWHLPCQPRQLSRVSMTRSKSCTPKIRPREPRSSSGRAPWKGATHPSLMRARGPAIWRSGDPLRPQRAFCSAHRLELQPQAGLLLKLLKGEVAEQFAHDHALLAEVEDGVVRVDGGHASDPGQRVGAILDQFAVPVAREQFHDHENLLRADREVHGATDRGNRVLAAGVPVGQVAGCRHLERAKHADVEVATTHHPERVGLVEI